jgi:Holliday junction resolvase RusA-like endonuclease
MDLTVEIGTLQNLLQEVLVGLDSIDSENFDEKFQHVIKKAEKAQNMRTELKLKYPANLLKKNEKELLFLTKQIRNCYDNLIKKNREESEALSAELRILMNSKKIANYSR